MVKTMGPGSRMFGFLLTFLCGCLAFHLANGYGDAEYYRTIPISVMTMTDPDTGLALDPNTGLALDPNAQYAPHGYRPGSATKTNTCQHVRGVPRQLRYATHMKPRGLTNFYQKYTETYGIPVVSSGRVRDDALRRACYTLRFLLASNSRVRNSFYRLSGRVAVIGVNEGTNWIPEHSNLPAWWNQRARGLGGTPHQPVSTGGEENVLCLSSDRYRAQDIFLHETAHGVHLLGAAYGIRGWDRRLRSLYNSAKRRGLWANTYSMSTPEEYFAEGTQAYFYVQSYAPRPDGVRGPINTREKLWGYDPALYNMIKEVFPCNNTYIKRCVKSRTQENTQVLKMDCEPGGGGGTDGGGTGTGTGTDCKDGSPSCVYWKSIGECTRNPAYMRFNCKKSCDTCDAVECLDLHSSCDYWKRGGECTGNPAYMNVNCKKACGKC